MKITNPRLFELDSRHIVRDKRPWKSSADPYFGKDFCLRQSLKDWFDDLNIKYQYGEFRLVHNSSARHTLYIEDLKDAMLFKLVWL